MTNFQTDNPTVYRSFLSVLLDATHNRLMDEAMDTSLPDHIWCIREDAYACATRAFDTHNYADTIAHLNRFWRI